MKLKNVLVSQSGGSTAVINNSLRGVIDTCKMFPDTFGTIYAGWHGIEGVLREELLNLSSQDEDEVALLRTTPAAGAIGTCRYKIKSGFEEDYERIIEVLKAHQIGYFLYNGGNDSMDTAAKIAALASARGLDLVAVGIPKTIDNDIGDSEFKLIDHTPGYGSIARYWAAAVQGANEENRGACPSDPVLVLQAMGRKIGYIPAAARLADPKREMPLLICLTESGISMEELAERVSEMVKQRGRCLVVVSEGFDTGGSGALTDSFGHIQFAAGKISAAQQVVNYLNEKGLPARGIARPNIYGTDQRNQSILASTIDLDEAYKVGQKAVLIAKDNGNGWMSTLIRHPSPIYNVYYDKVPLEKVANSERFFPDQWISPDRTDVTDAFLDYVRPLIGEDWVSVPIINGIQRFARLKRNFADQKLPPYLPQGQRS